MAFDREQVKKKAAELAAKGVYVGTSSWKYEGWLGQLYTPARYGKINKVSAKKSDNGWLPGLETEAQPKKPEKVDGNRFKSDCLSEYAEVFKTVGVDSAYYTFPRAEYLQGLAAQVPDNFKFGFKVTDAITIKRYANHPDQGAKAGQLNKDFLDADLFAAAFLEPCNTIRASVGVLMFEFSPFWPSDYKRCGDFISDLDLFLRRLPKGWPYAIELRNKDWLQPDYLDCLRHHGITHVYNNWEDMPAVSEQMALRGSRTNPKLVAARFLLKPGRKYEQAVKTFEPYDKVRELNPDARAAGQALISEGLEAPDRDTFIYVNNRLEGNAPETIEAMVEADYFRVMKGFDDRRSS